MNLGTRLGLITGVLATGILIEDIINSAYESAIRAFDKYPVLKNNPIGKSVESALINRYLSRAF